MKPLRIATRKSRLALWQAAYVRDRLLQLHPGLKIELVELTTQGDLQLDMSLAKIGGKGLFIKELEQALLEHRADIAVHSMKDVTVTIPDKLVIPVICEREDARDVFVCARHENLDALPPGALIGTSSLRRLCQIKHRYPRLNISPLRGNVTTRLEKLDAGRYDAVILAAAGLKRLGLAARIRSYLEPDLCLPAVGQGAIGIECRRGDKKIIGLVMPLHHAPTALCVGIERDMNAALNGGCQVPVGGHATINQKTVTLRGLVGDPTGGKILRAEGSADVSAAGALGANVAAQLLAQGAQHILARAYGQSGADKK